MRTHARANARGERKREFAIQSVTFARHTYHNDDNDDDEKEEEEEEDERRGR